jgi:hypothetical protein
MTLKSTREHLIQLLAEKENKVIALSGKWGTGKSHLWREVKTESRDEEVKAALYVSLFGLADVNQIKIKLAQSALSSVKKDSAALVKAVDSIKAVKKILTSFNKSFSVLDELALLAVPSLLKDKVIALDDIERKHVKLSIDEVLGFIDEFTHQYGVRFVLILNSDQLEDKKVWDTLREKVVDQELCLNTSTGEAFDIAIELAPSRYSNKIRAAAEACQLTNIRIVRKVIKVVNRILGDRGDLSDALLTRVVPSAVLLAAIHFRGIVDGLDFEFVLANGVATDWDAFLTERRVEDKDEKRKSRWKALLGELRINGFNDYELLIMEFLRSGLFDPTAITAIINRYASQDDVMTALDNFKEFFEDMNWNYHLTDAELLGRGKELQTKVHLIDAYTFTALHDEVEKLKEGTEVARNMLNLWIASFKTRNLNNFSDENPFKQKVHPSIQAEFDAIIVNAETKITVFDAIEDFFKNNGWGLRHELAICTATVEDFEATIKTIEIKKLQFFMRKMLELTATGNSWQPHVVDSTTLFVKACNNIIRDSSLVRLAALIEKQFLKAGIGHLIVQVDQVSEQSQGTPSSN